MADLKFRTGASASVTKEKSLEEKLAGIIGTSTGAIKSLETQLRREREAEEARKKAEEEARKRAEAAAAANTAARTEADNKARLADLLTAANRAGVAQSSKNAKMVAFGEGETGAYTTKPTTTVREQKVKPNLPTLPTVNTPVATPPAKGDVKAVTLEDQYGVNVDEDAMRTRLEEMERELNTAGRLGDQAKVKELGSGVNALRKALGAREETAKIEERNAQKRAASAAAEAAQQAELDRFQKYDAMDAGQMEGQIRELENRLQVVEDSIAANDRKALEAYRRGEMIEYNRYENERVRLTQMRDALEDELRALNDAYAQKAQFDQEYSAHDKMMMRNVGVAQTRMDVAADAAQKNAAYIQAQGVKLGQLETKIKTFAGDPSSPEYAALINEYNVAADLYNQAIALSSRHDAQLVDSIGAYYDALDARGTLDPVYQQSYEKAIGLTAQIDGLQRQLDELYLQQKAAAEAGNTGAAEVLNQQISAIDEQIMALMKERAPLADYAYTYDMTRTLDELPENDLYLFRSVASEDYSAFTAGVGNPEQARAQLLEKYSEKEFDRILGYVQRQYNAEKAAQRQEKYEQLSSTFGGAVLATVASVVTNVIGAPGAVYEIVKQGLENSGTMTPYDTNAAGFWAQNATRGLRGAVSEQINNPVGEFVYQTLTSAIDSAAAMALAGASGGVLLGVSAAANSMQDIAERGGDLGQIVAGGVMAGVFEGLFEQYSIGNFYALKDVPTTTYRDMARNILTSAGVNAQEEAATELANIMYDFIALGDASNYAIRLRELMTQDGLTEAQAKKALAMESATQIALAAASGALMGVGFGATGSVDSYIRVRRGEVVQPDDTEVFRSYMTTRTIAAAYLPADRRPNMSYVSGRTTQDDVEYYAQIVLDRMKEENRKAQQEREADREAAQLRAEQEQERAEIKVRTLQTAAEVAETAVQAETSANTDAAQTQQEPVAAAPVQQAETAAVMPQEVRNVRTVSNVQTAQNTPVSFDTDDVSAFVVEEAAEIYESLSMNEGTMLDSAVQDEARALRQEGREDVATALEQMHREIGGVNYGDSIGQRSERDAGESAGGEAGTVAESAGSDQSRDVQTGREETGSAAREDYEAGRKIKLSAYGIHDVAENQTLTEITDTSSDPEIIEITNAAKLAGVEVHVVREQIRTKTGKRAGGAYENGVIIVSTSDPTFTPTQIFNHELFHAMQENTPGLLTETTQLLLDNYTDEEFDALVAAYQQLYAGLGLEDEDIFKEICADMYAGMVREQLAAAKNANLPQLTQEARRIVREKANVTAAGESDANGTRSDSQPSVKARFSMSSPVEQTDTLIALHNMDEEKLRRTLALGAWPSPSIAIVEAEQGHTNYGEYSAVFPRSTIDPEEDSRNRVYGSDAWTPTHSNAQVEYEVNYDVLRTFERDVESLAKQIADGVFSTSSVLRMMGVEDQTEYDLDEIAKRLADKAAVKAAYLADHGEDVEVVYRKKTFDNFGNDTLHSYVEKIGPQEAARLAAKMMVGERLTEAEIETAKDVIMEHWIASHEKALNAKPELRERRIANQREKLSDIRAEDFVRHAWEFYEDNGAVTDEVDRMATSDNLADAVDTQDVQAWAKEMLDGLLGEPGIYNGREFYDSRGNRRSFQDTHWEYSVENIVRAMNNAEGRGANMFGVGASGLIATATPEYGSVSQIHADESRLRTVDKEEYDQIVENLNTTLDRVVKDIMRSTEHHADNTFEEMEIIETVIAEAAQGKRTISAIKRVFSRNGYAISDPQAKAVLDLLKEVAKVPTGYFEAKPQRVVAFDEAVAVVAPDNADKDLLKEMRDAGMNVETYKAGDEKDRLAVINGLNGVRFSISDDATELMQDTETLTKRLEAVEKDLEDFEVNIGSPEDSTARVQYLELQMKKTAIETELHERTMRAREAAMREGEPERAEKLDELKLIEAHEQELWAEAAAERRAWKEDENQEHLANAENLKEQARAERRKANKLRKELGITRAQEYRPADAMQQTGTAILKAFGIPKAQRAQMRQELNTVFERILTHGYVSNNELDSVVRTLYENGKGTVRPASEAHQRIAADLKGKTLYLDLDMRKTYKDQEWNDIRAELYRLGVKTSRVENEGTTRVEDMYELLKTAYPEVFTAEALTPQAKLEAMLEAGQLGTTRRVKLESTESKTTFDELMKTVKRELATFTKVAGLENRMREETQRTREYYDNLAKEATERRVRSELMTRTRNTVKRLARMAERNDALLNKTLAQLDPDLRKTAENAMQTLDLVANRMTGKTKAGLLALRDSVLEVYNVRDSDEYKAEYEMYVPAEVRAAIPALERLGKVQINDLTLDELQTLVTAVNVITENLDRMNRIISDSWDQQLDNAGRELLKEIEENTDGAKGNSNAAAFWNEKSLSPSRALLRLVGYDRSGVMGHVVEDFEQGDRDVMGYTIGADRIFADFIADAENRKWLKTAAGKNAAFIDVDIPAVLEVGKGDKPILDKDKPGALTVRMQITPMMVVQMARDLQNEQNIRHFEEGGYTFPSIALYKKGNTGAMFVQGERTFRLSRDFVQQIVDQHLGEVGKKYVKLLDQYYNVFSKNHINHTSQLLTGEDKAIADSYNPLRTDAAYRGKTYNVFDGTIEGMGSLKSRQQLASSPIMLDDADATFQWHKESIAKYVGYAVPMRNFKALMNYKPAHQSKTIHAVIGEKFGSNASKFITDFIAFVDAGEIEHVESLKFLEKLTDAYIGNVLSFNISSALKQISALATAGTSYGQGVVIKAMVTFKAVDEELIRIYTPYLDYRGAGYSTVEIANFVRALEDARMSKLAQFVAGKSWLTRTDLWVNRRLWLAAEYVVQNTTQLRPSSDMAIVKSGNDPYYKAVAEVFNRMTHDTQTNYNTMSRPMILRSKNAIVRALTMFKTDAYQIQGIAREAFGAYRTAKRKYNASQTEANEAELRRAKAQLVRSMTGILTSSLMSSILGNFIRLLRNWKEYKDEDGKFSWEKFFEKMPKALFQDTLSNITGAVLLGDQLTDVVYSWIFGDTFWEPEIVSFSTLKDLCDSLDKLGENFGKYISTIRYLRDGGEDWQSYMKNHADAIMGDLRKAMYQIAQALGVPLKNIEKTLLMPFEIFAPELATAYQDFFGDFEKASLANTTGEEREAALHAYLTDEVGDLGETAEAEILRLYELYGNKALPGSDAPTSVKELDENGNEIERKPTLTELGNWDAEYRRKMMDSLGELIGSDFYNSLSDEEKLKLISRANEYARNTAKEYAGMPVNYEKWMENVSSAIDAGTDLASALYFYTKASTLKADKDENGEAISGSLALKELALLESMDTSGAAKLDLLEGVLSPAQLENLDMLLNAGYDVDGAVNMIRTSLETGKSLKSFTKYLEQGFDREAAQELYEAMAALEPEEGKRQVSNAQEYEAILASGLDDAEKWTAFAGMFDADEEKALAKMEAVRAAGGTPDDYAELRQIGQVDAYLRGVENGLSANTALRVVNAVAALPDLPEGESYDTSERQLAAVQACGTPEEQIIAYAMYGTSTSAKTNTAKFTAALAYDVTPEMYLEARALAKASYDADANGSLKQEEVVAALEAMDLTDRQRAALFQLFDSGWKKNPYGNTADIRDAYAAAKEDK